MIIKKILIGVFTLIICNSCAAKNKDTTQSVGEKHEYFKQLLKDKSIDGIAVALFTNDKIIWKECIGKSTYNKPINDSMLFFICSISKNMTALAVMLAVQDGLLDLDTPIIKYLPDFKINSCYEESPTEKITLRMMLSHTAGFSHEAPIGNDIDFRCKSKQEHWNSIRDTWLMFPVNTSYSYSALGFDLAAEIVEKVSGISFETYVKEKIFTPLEMKYSTLSDSEVLSNKNRTEGILNPFVTKKHKKTPMIGAGAVYSSIDEMVKYVQFQLNLGKVNNKQLIEKKNLFEMYKINKNFYGLGTNIEPVKDDSILNTFFLSHNGGGFGYACTMIWFPEYGVGCVVLGNKTFNFFNIAKNLTIEYILKNETILNNKNLNIGFTPVFKPKENYNFYNQKHDFIYPKDTNKNAVVLKSTIVGKYEIILDNSIGKFYTKIVAFLGIKVVTVTVSQKEGKLIVDGMLGKHELKEYTSGLYFTDKGDVFDIRKSVPSFQNVKLKKYSDKQ